MLTDDVKEICTLIELEELKEVEKQKPVPAKVNDADLDRAIILLTELLEIKRVRADGRG